MTFILIFGGFTLTESLDNGCWLTCSTIIVAIVIWAFDEPKTRIGKRALFPVWCCAFMLSVIGTLFFLINQIEAGKFILVFELSGILILALILFSISILSLIGMDFKFLRQRDIHSNIDKGSYFSD